MIHKQLDSLKKPGSNTSVYPISKIYGCLSIIGNVKRIDSIIIALEGIIGALGSIVGYVWSDWGITFRVLGRIWNTIVACPLML